MGNFMRAVLSFVIGPFETNAHPAGTLGERSLPFDFKGRELSPKVPVEAGLFVRNHSS
jgi:hypothetical protein